MKKISLLLLLFLPFSSLIQAQDFSLFKKEWIIQDGDTLPYRILLPDGFDSTRSYPLVLFLHGRGESGTDNEKQLTHGAKLFVADSFRKKYPSIVVFPQCPANNYWSNVHAVTEGSKNGKRAFYFVPGGEPTRALRGVMGLVENLQARFRISQQQVYVMGLSMGGMGTFELVRRMPGTFAAAIPICGGANPATASKLTGTSWWIFHGGKDDVVLPVNSIRMADALRKLKAQVKFTLFPEANHNSWDPAFAEPVLMKWLFSQRKKTIPSNK
jgi:predicted peptidase